MKRCKCLVRDKSKWVVITRREQPLTSRLKCLRCSIKWWSKCKYVATLRDHAERSCKGLTDQDILDRINEGSLWVKSEDIFSKTQFGESLLTPLSRTSNGSEYKFVTIWKANKKKKIAVHRVVWMYHNRCLVPDGFDVDHKLGKSVPNANAIDNLQLLPASVNRSNKTGLDF